MKELERASPRESFVEADVETASEASSEQDYSYEFAQMEVIMKTLGNNGMISLYLNMAVDACVVDFVVICKKNKWQAEYKTKKV